MFKINPVQTRSCYDPLIVSPKKDRMITTALKIVTLIPIITSFFYYAGKGIKNWLFTPQKSPTSEPVVLKPLQELWGELRKKTTQQKVDFLSDQEANHRFEDILCPMKTAIQVGNRYLHANQVTPTLIASQAPLPEDYETFWQAVFARDATIVDLTNGAAKYYPETNDIVQTHGNISIRLLTTDETSHYYSVTFNNDQKTIHRIHYNAWPDHDVIKLDPFIELVEKVGNNTGKAAWVHCRAGIGRTGTLITALILREQIRQGNITKANLDASLVKIIADLRTKRGPHFVQTSEQLELLRQYACAQIESLYDDN